MLTELEPTKCDLCTPGYAAPGHKLCQPCLEMLRRCVDAYWAINEAPTERTER